MGSHAHDCPCVPVWPREYAALCSPHRPPHAVRMPHAHCEYDLFVLCDFRKRMRNKRQYLRAAARRLRASHHGALTVGGAGADTRRGDVGIWKDGAEFFCHFVLEPRTERGLRRGTGDDRGEPGKPFEWGLNACVLSEETSVTTFPPSVTPPSSPDRSIAFCPDAMIQEDSSQDPNVLQSRPPLRLRYFKDLRRPRRGALFLTLTESAPSRRRMETISIVPGTFRKRKGVKFGDGSSEGSKGKETTSAGSCSIFRTSFPPNHCSNDTVPAQIRRFALFLPAQNSIMSVGGSGKTLQTVRLWFVYRI
jgi:hypothetical protein